MSWSKIATIWCAAALILGLPDVLSPVPFANAQPVEFILDFESGDLMGWQMSGNAFRHQPTLGDNPTARDRGQPPRHQGRWWIGTYEHYQGRPRERPGGIQGDAPTGTLTSARFSVPPGTLTFLVGGGDSFETRVELVVVGEGGDPEFNQDRAYHASGRNTESMHEVTWDLTPYAGREAFIRIVDASSGGWGHINADDFRFLPGPRMRPIDPRVLRPPIGRPLEPAPAIVPDVVGMTLPQAEATLQEARLEPGNIRTRVPDYFNGRVIRQSLKAGTREPRGTSVDLLLGGPPLISVPNVIGMPIRRAARELESIGLVPGDVHEQTSAAQEPGTVMDQDPPPGSKIPVESPVLLVIAVPPEIIWVSIPDVNGLTPKKAEFLLAREQLALGRITMRESERKENTIIQQDPGVGHQVRTGTAVNVVIAAQTRVEVPDLIDLQLEQIEALLARARLRMGDIQERESSKQTGIVLAQRPEAHAQVPVGTTVDIEIAKQKAPGIVNVVVPDAIGLRIPSARQQFLKARLVPGELSQIPSDLDPGTVLRQRPPAGARVPPGTAVKLWTATEKTLDPRWLGVPLVLLLGLGGAYLMRYRARSQGNAETLIDGLVITAHADPGSVHLQTDHPTDLALEIRLRPVSDAGSQRLVSQGDLIEKESREP